jgi:ATP-dependent DNA helicase PIF1
MCLHGNIAFAVTFSGIVALLLSGGQTTHSYLKISIALDCMSLCYIHKQDDLAELIRQTKLILWDEAPMINKLTFEVVDRILRDLIDRNEPFGGIIFVMSGDFCQVLPVIPRGSHADIDSTSIKNSYLWESIEVFCLLENMRADDGVVIHLDLGNLHQSRTPTYGNLLRYFVFQKICGLVMPLLFTSILGIALL